MPEGTCSIEGCGRPHYARTLCRYHYDQDRHGGLLAARPRTQKRLGTCIAEGCDARAVAKDLCPKHRERFKRHGDIVTVQRRTATGEPPPVLCTIEGCNEPYYAQVWCKNHYQNWSRHGDPLFERRRYVRQGSECSVEGCDRKPKHHGMCAKHAAAVHRAEHPEWYKIYGEIRRARESLLPSDLTAAQWARILAACDWRCAWDCPCSAGHTGCMDETLSIEHLVPISRGIIDGLGGTTAANCLPACRSCNSKKNAATPAEWAARGGFRLRIL